MKKLFLLAFALLLSSFHSLLVAKDIDVILIGGQSNAAGQGMVKNLPTSFTPNAQVLIFYSKYLNRGKNSEQILPLCPASESPDRFGLELSLGNTLQEKYPKRQFALLKHASSGTNLFYQWNPHRPDQTLANSEYQRWLDTVKKGCAALQKEGYTPRLRALLWQQGEADARDTAGEQNARAYAQNLKNFITKVRQDLKTPDLLFVYGTVMPRKAERFTYRDIVKKAQQDICEKSSSPHAVKGALLVEADHLQMLDQDYKTTQPKDDVHLGTMGILVLGQRMAQTLIQDPRFLKN